MNGEGFGAHVAMNWRKDTVENTTAIRTLAAQYRRALTYVLPYWRSLLLVMVLGLLSTVIGLAQPYISRVLIDRALLGHDLHALVKIASAMVFISITGFALNIVSSYQYVRLSAESLFDMRLAVYQHLQTLSPRFFGKSKLGDLVSRINNDIVFEYFLPVGQLGGHGLAQLETLPCQCHSASCEPRCASPLSEAPRCRDENSP
jgi:hypothetical protein